MGTSQRYAFRLGAGLLALWAAAQLAAQNVAGTIVGTIRDVSGGAIVAASVTVTNEGTNVAFKTKTNETGDYVAPNLAPGSYTVTAEFEGFKQAVIKSVRLLANRTVRVDLALEPGTVTQTIEVQGTAPVVNSENATIGNILESSVITAIPLNGRTLDRLIRISAGVTTDSASNPRVAGSAYWGGIQFNVDGVTYNDTGNGGGAYSYRNGLATLPSVDSVSEFKIDSNNQKAEFEGSVSATIVTKAGTNEFHGSVLWFNRNKAYAAKNFFATGLPNPPFNRNEFGYTVGGPIVKNKTFFFHSYEGLRERTSRTNTLSVATQAMRAGDFTGLPVIVDPLSGQPFPNNQVPASRLDARAKALIDWVPLPNQAGSGPAGTLNNYVVNIPNISDINRYGVRIDHRFSDQDSIWVNLNHSIGDPYFVAQAYPPRYGSWENGGYSTQSANITYVRNFSPRTLNELRLGYLRHASVRQGMNANFDPRSLFPDLYPVPYGGLPNINISSHVSIGDYGGGPRAPQLTPQYIDNLTLVRGKHTIKTGFDFANHRVSSVPFTPGMLSGLANNAALGRFDFNGRFTNNDPSRAAQPAHAFADFLLGYPNFAYRSTSSPPLLLYSTRYSAYVQDDFQVSPLLTLTFGLRYMVQTSWKERDQALANFDFASSRLFIAGDRFPAQAQPRLVQAYPIVLAKDAGLPQNLLETDKNNFGPRLGFALRPFRDSRTVIRGGFGVYYNFLPVYIGFRQMGFNNPPFLLAESFESAAGRTPSLTLERPFPGAGAISPNPSLTAVERNIRNSESYQWNFTVEREIRPNLGVRASYVGNKSTHLPWYNYEVNLPRVQQAGALQAQRPFQPWSNVLVLAGGGDSNIHQLQLEAIQRYRSGLTFQLEYSWNRSLDNVPIVGGPQNPYNARGDRGNSDQVRRHIFTAAYSYELPFGPGKRFANVRGVAGQIVGGWQIAGITYLRTGPPFSVTFNATLPGWLGGRADVLRDPKLPRSERSIYRWFDASAFAVPAPYTWGNSARNLLFAPGDIVFDVSVLKDFSLAERAKVQFRAEFFNLPNHANFGGPAANISVPASVGRIFSAGDPRQIQFGLKVLF
jgi:hypothetical protein